MTIGLEGRFLSNDFNGVAVENGRFTQLEINGLERNCKPKMTPQLYLYRWDRQGRKGQTCRATARGKFNSIRVVFADGFVMITSGNAIRKAKL